MRDPLNLQSVEEDFREEQIIIMDDIPEFSFQDWDLFDDKEFKKYLFSIEKDVRNSFEYKQMTKYLREYMDMNKCSFYENVSNVDTTKIKIHIHHEPIDLFTIASVVYNKRVATGESLEEEQVAKEVMYLHYTLLVGLIPLAETIHELVHNQYLFVPTSNVMGKYKEFVDRYRPYFTPEQLDILDRIEDFTNAYDFNLDVLNKKYIYIDMSGSGSYRMPTAEQLVQCMKDRIDQIKNSPPPSQ